MSINWGKTAANGIFEPKLPCVLLNDHLKREGTFFPINTSPLSLGPIPRGSSKSILKASKLDKTTISKLNSSLICSQQAAK